MLISVCFMILASEGMPKLKRKETKAKEGKMAKQDATTKVVSGMRVDLQSHTDCIGNLLVCFCSLCWS
jgi:hypothetical protein